MSNELPRWKEYRIRQEIYKEGLKHAETVSDRLDSDGPSPELPTDSVKVTIAFFDRTSAKAA